MWADFTEPPGHPLHATLPTPGRPHHGERIALVAAATGTPLMPWQQYAAQVATEMLPDGSFAYPIVVVSVPRQSGKTVLIRSVNVERCISYPGAECFYTAQSGKDAAARWKDAVKALYASPLADEITVYRSAGSQRVEFPNLSVFQCFAPLEKSLHGYTPDMVTLDEAMAHDAERGAELMAAIGPAQQTVRHRQLWIVSTMGTSESVFLHGWIDRARRGEPGICLIEYGVPDGLDVYDPAVWLEYHPGFVQGHPFIRPDGSPQVTVAVLQSEAAYQERADFERMYCNRRTSHKKMLIPADLWEPLAGHQDRPDTTELVLAFDVAYDKSASTIVAVWRDLTGRLQTRIVMAGQGTSWLRGALTELRASWSPIAVAADDGGHAREICDGLDWVTTTSAREFATATGQLLTAVKDGQLCHDGTEIFKGSATSVVTRPMGDGVAISRRHSTGDSSPMVALAVGAWVYDHAPAPTGRPFIQFAS